MGQQSRPATQAPEPDPGTVDTPAAGNAGWLNPPAHRLGTLNAVMGSAGAGPHHVREFAGPLSIKLMIRGSGVWRTDAGVHHVEEGFFLILNHGQTYSLDIEGHLPRESFCPVFRAGFVEDIHRTMTGSPDMLLDDPDADPVMLRFHQHLHARDPAVVPALRALRRLAYDGTTEAVELDAAFHRLGEALVEHALDEVAAQVARVPASRPSTRMECHRRLARGRDYLHANAHQGVDLRRVAREACLSPYHFHRLFRAVHGLTPHQYLSHVRLQRACRLLVDSDLPVHDIALSVGFESHAAFSRRFRRAFGMSPGLYRGARG